MNSIKFRLFVLLGSFALSLTALAEAPIDGIQVDPKLVVRKTIDVSEEKQESVGCVVLEGNYWMKTGSPTPEPMSCDEARSFYLKRRKNGKVKNDWQYSFTDVFGYGRDVGVTLTLKDGSVVQVGPFHERRRQAGSHSRAYPNPERIADATIDPILTHKDSLYTNQYGVCYREVLVIARSGTPMSERQAFPRPEFLDCEKIDRSKLELREIAEE